MKFRELLQITFSGIQLAIAVVMAFIITSIVVAACRAEIVISGTGTSTAAHYGVKFHPFVDGVGWEYLDSPRPVPVLREPVSYSYDAIWDVAAGEIRVPSFSIELPEIGKTIRAVWYENRRTLIRPGVPEMCDAFQCIPEQPPVYAPNRVTYELEGMLPSTTVQVPEQLFDVRYVGRDTLTVAPKNPIDPVKFDMAIEWDADRSGGSRGAFSEHGEFPLEGRVRTDMRFTLTRDEDGKVVSITPHHSSYQYRGVDYYTAPSLRDPENVGYFHAGGVRVSVPEPDSLMYFAVLAGVVCGVRFAHGALQSRSGRDLITIDET